MTRLATQSSFRRPEFKVIARMGFDEFLKTHFENEHVEWVYGEVIEIAPVSNEHQFVVSFLIRLLEEFCLLTDAGVVLFDPFQMKLPSQLVSRAPDVLFVAKRNLGRLKKVFLNGPADLVVEVISPGTGMVDRGTKFDEYEEGGVKEYWLIDPLRKEATFFTRNRRGIFEKIDIENGMMRSVVMPGLYLKIDWLWKRPSVVGILREMKLLKD